MSRYMWMEETETRLYIKTSKGGGGGGASWSRGKDQAWKKTWKLPNGARGFSFLKAKRKTSAKVATARWQRLPLLHKFKTFAAMFFGLTGGGNAFFKTHTYHTSSLNESGHFAIVFYQHFGFGHIRNINLARGNLHGNLSFFFSLNAVQYTFCLTLTLTQGYGQKQHEKQTIKSCCLILRP